MFDRFVVNYGVMLGPVVDIWNRVHGFDHIDVMVGAGVDHLFMNHLFMMCYVLYYVNGLVGHSVGAGVWDVLLMGVLRI